MDLTSSLSQRLKYLRSLTKLSRASLVQKHRNIVSESTIKLWENGKVIPSDKAIHMYIDLFNNEGINASYDWIKNGFGPIPTQKLYQEANKAFPKSDILDLSNDFNYLKHTYPNLFITFITNDEMMPNFQIGDMVAGIFKFNNFDKFNNRNCIISLENRIVIRKLIVNGDHFNLISINPFTNCLDPIIFDANIKSLAPIVFHRSIHE